MYPCCSVHFDRDLGALFTAPFDLLLLQSNGPSPTTLWVIDIETNACATYRPLDQNWHTPYVAPLDGKHATSCAIQRRKNWSAACKCDCLRSVNRTYGAITDHLQVDAGSIAAGAITAEKIASAAVTDTVPWDGTPPVVS